MELRIKDLGKRFNFTWIFNHLSLNILPGERLAILGSNGSGKSTLLQILSGAMIPSYGSLEWITAEKSIDPEQVYRNVSFAAPYMELMEEFTLQEHLDFHFSIKEPAGKLKVNEILYISGLSGVADRRIGYFSSGMKQRVKLTLALLSDTRLLLLDEPLSNLDKEATGWYQDLIRQFGAQRTILVCSNHQEAEYSFCTTSVNIADYK